MTQFLCFKDLLFNENGAGWLCDKMKRKREAIKKQRDKENAQHILQSELEQSSADYSEYDAQNDFEILKSTVVNDESPIESLNFIKDKLILTQNYRTQILANMRTDLRESFPYFFVRSELVRRSNVMNSIDEFLMKYFLF